MAVYVNLEKVLISQVSINEVIQRVEYEYLPTMCFLCGHYGHIKELCPNKIDEQKAIEARVANGKDERTNNITAHLDETLKERADVRCDHCKEMVAKFQEQQGSRASKH
ncbi:hypothetical protein PVK06_048780 [Gossypium arboreum]|uniref:CCHC-type domain-containing protein n=1 Tax=Gossypium arboreum TaxID=29729 RepID=A0ABR0MGT2_GOSAR|nr:hypothetical protein PVK06_048780 [Gossypium arboreum]